jgi:NADH dehydrogenase
MHRAYHLSRMPTWNRRVRIAFDWFGAFLMGREVVALGQINDPRAEFNRVSGGGGTPSEPAPVESSGVDSFSEENIATGQPRT